MQYQSVLPENFDGTFRFTNWTDQDFIGKWDGKEYRFAAGTTSPIIIADQTPLEIQSIRKKFAKDLAEQEFFKGQGYAQLHLQERNNDGSPRLNSIHQAGTYSIETLAPFIQRCLEPLAVARAVVTEAQKVNMEDKLTRDESGEINSIVVKQNGDLIEEKKSLRQKALKTA